MAAEEGKRNCSYCGGLIFAQAIKCRHCKQDVKPIEDSNQDESYKDCPHCGGLILAKALKCKHCKEFTDQQTKPSDIKAPSFQDKRGNSTGNLKHWGYSAYYDDWIYFANDLDEDCIYKVHNDGKDIFKVSTIGAESINIIDGKIYFINKNDKDGIYTVSTDGSNQVKILNHIACNLRVVNDTLYFQGVSEDKSLYRANVKGKKIRNICTNEVHDYDVSEDWVYFCDPDDNFSLYKMTVDGKCKTKILNEVSNGQEEDDDFDENGYVSDVTVVGDYIYFAEDQSVIYRVRKNDIKKEKITIYNDNGDDISVAWKSRLIFTAEWIYYITLNDDTLFKVPAIGGIAVKMTEIALQDFEVVGNWLFCVDWSPRLMKINRNNFTASHIDNSPIDDLIEADEKRKAKAHREAKKKAAEEKKKAAEEKLEAASIVNLAGRGNTSFNIANDGLACEYEGWIYYIDGSDNASIYKMRSDGSDNVRVNSNSSDYLNVIGDWIIFRNWNDSQRIHRIKIDGGESKRVFDKGTSLVKVVDEWVYFLGEICFETEEHKNLYRVKLDGSEEQYIAKIYNSFDIYDDRIYYLGNEDEEFRIFSMRPDCSDKQVVYDDIVLSLLGIDKGWLYFLSAMDDLYRLNLNDGELNRLAAYNDDKELVGLSKGSITDNWYYFINSFNDEALYRVNFDGSGLELIVNEAIESINIAGRWLFYKKQNQYDLENSSYTSDDNVYRIKLDHPISDVNYKVVEKVDTITVDTMSAGITNMVYTQGLRINIPEGYIYTTDSDETCGRIIVAIIPNDESINSIDADFRIYSRESIFISEMARTNQELDLNNNADDMIQAFTMTMPGEAELVNKDESMIRLLYELMPQGEDEECLIYNGILISKNGVFYTVQVQFNYNDDIDVLKQKTKDILCGISLTGDAEEVDYYSPLSIKEQLENNSQKAKESLTLAGEELIQGLKDEIGDTDDPEALELINDVQSGLGELNRAIDALSDLTTNDEWSGDLPVAYPPENICAMHLQSFATNSVVGNMQDLFAGKINIHINRGVDLGMEAVKIGVATPPYQNKAVAWDYALAFRVDENAFQGSYDREGEIKNSFIRSVANLSALRSFAWTVQGYMLKQVRSLSSATLDDIMVIADFVENRGFLNYTSESYFPALCGVPDFDAAYLALPLNDPSFTDACALTGCEACGELFTLREELTILTPMMRIIYDDLMENRGDTTEQLMGTLSDILYAWCALSLAADTNFKIADGTMNYFFDRSEGGVENYSLPYWESFDEEDECKPALVKVIDAMSFFRNVDFNRTYFEADLVGTSYEGRAPRFEYLSVGESVDLIRNADNIYDTNAIEVCNSYGESLGHLPKDYAAVLAPAIDDGMLYFESAEVLSVTPLSARGPRAKNPLMTISVRLAYSIFQSNENTKNNYESFEGETCLASNQDNLATTNGTIIKIPDNDIWIESEAYKDCTNITSVVIPDSVTEIGFSAFEGCTSLKTINIPDSVTVIGFAAFKGCTSLMNINIPDNVTEIESWTFEGCSSLTGINIPNSVTEIGSSAFEGCTSLKTIIIPDSVTEIGSEAFEDCASLIIKGKPGSVAHEYATAEGIGFERL